MHHFILEERAGELLEPGLRARIKRNRNKVDDMYGYGHLFADEVRSAVRDLVERGHFAKERVPAAFGTTMNAMFKEPEAFGWTMAEPDGTERFEAMRFDDMLLVGGLIAAEILEPDEFWAPHAGFSAPSDLHSTVGILAMRNRDHFFDVGGGTWESVHEGRAYRSAVTGSNHGDLRIFRAREGFVPTKDPFGNAVHYRPTADEDRQMVSAYHSTEPTLLAATLKYIHQEKLDVPCLRDGGKKLLGEFGRKGQYLGNFGDFGQGGGNMDALFWDFAFPMNEANAEKSVFWHLGCDPHSDSAYRIHIDGKRHLAFTLVDGKGHAGPRPSLTLPPEEMDQFVRALLAQTQQGKGRTSMAQLAQVLEYRFAPDFEAKMKDTYDRIFKA